MRRRFGKVEGQFRGFPLGNTFTWCSEIGRTTGTRTGGQSADSGCLGGGGEARCGEAGRSDGVAYGCRRSYNGIC